MEIKLKNGKQVKGTRILIGKEASHLKGLMDTLGSMASLQQFQRIIMPLIEPTSIYEDKLGGDTGGQMYEFQDRGGRNLCLRPEGTATVQELGNTTFKNHKDVKLYYNTRCYRYERPQEGRYREFWQLGLEHLWPRDRDQATEDLIELAISMFDFLKLENGKDYIINHSVERGLGYYTKRGFEFSMPILGAQKQVLGGGEYTEGVGFAIGIDRLKLALDKIGYYDENETT